jgi:hypothetical protein
MSAIDAYLGELRGRLVGPASAKRDLLKEARHGLGDAAEAYREGGLSVFEAERRAVGEFGPVAVIAREYQAELAMHSGVRALWKVILGVPTLLVAWDVARALTFGDWSRFATPTPDWYLHAVGAAHLAAVLVPVVGIAGVVVARLRSRREGGTGAVRAAWFPAAGAAGLNLLAVALFGGATGLLDPARLFVSVPCAVLSSVWVLFSLWLVVVVRRYWRISAVRMA